MESFESMLFSPRPRPLRVLVDELKDGATTCQSCGDVVARFTTIHKGRVVPRAELLRLKEKIAEDDWIDQRHEWKHVCRFCSYIETASRQAPLDLVGFHRWLKGHGSIKPGTVHEYCVRVKRILDKLDHGYIQAAVDAGEVVEGIVSQFPEVDAPGYRRALQKYSVYLARCRPA